MMSEEKQLELLRQILLLNELEGNQRAAYRFSDPDGVKTGKSGWSFGESQFDTQNNPIALECLKQCGFTLEQIDGIVKQTVDIKPFNDVLKQHAEIIDRYDRVQRVDCLRRVKSIAVAKGFTYFDYKALLTAADYDNQFHMSPKMKPGYLCYHLAKLGRPATAKDIVKFKLTTKWGKKRSDDVERRAANIDKVFAEVA